SPSLREWLLCGIRSGDAKFAFGSARVDHAGELTAEKLTSRLRGGIAVGHGRQGPARGRHTTRRHQPDIYQLGSGGWRVPSAALTRRATPPSNGSIASIASARPLCLSSDPGRGTPAPQWLARVETPC